MNAITTPRKIVIDYCRRAYKKSPIKVAPAQFGMTLASIYTDLHSGVGIISSSQARRIADEAWALITPLVGDDMAPVYSCLKLSDAFEQMLDEDRVDSLAFLVASFDADDTTALQCAQILSLAIRTATDALLAASPEMFQEG